MKKNIISMAAAMAVLSACGPGVPQLGKSSLDEVIGAMKAIGDAMPKSLKETAEGGLADTPTAKKIAREILH